jgi:hypothetical protein
MKSKFILSFLFSLIISVAAGFGIEMATGFNGYAVAGIIQVCQFIPMGAGLTMAGVYREVWTGAVKTEMSKLEEATFLDGIEDFSRYVSNVGDEMQVIHITYMGVLPDVLVNNTTYPIDLQTLGEDDVPITLDKLQTKVTPVTDDELYALTYDKIGTVKSKHAKAIDRTKKKKAIHAIAPASNKALTPVLLTTGDDDGTGRKRLTLKDIVDLKGKFDAQEIPDVGRRLVLTDEHVNDLLLVDQNFKEQYYNYTTGKIANLYGFEVYAYSGCPYFNPATKVKLSFGAVPAATDHKASVAFSLERVAKASGWVKMYSGEAKKDPQYQRNTLAFRHNFIVLPTKEEARGAIVSANV